MSAAPLVATAPHLLMSDGATGWAVWPSAGSWLLLRTTDGWKHVVNRTPIAVPTGGGLVAAVSADKVVVALGAYERLTRSPVLTGSGAAVQWSPAELPGAISDARSAVSVAGSRIAVVLSDTAGTIMAGAHNRWVRLTTAAVLSPEGNLRLDGVTWASGTLGWLTGHGQAGTPKAFQTTDSGRSWVPLRPDTGAPVATLAPCGAANSWLLPVIAGDGTTRVGRSTDGGRHWSWGAPVQVPGGAPAWGCRGDQVWMAGRAGQSDHIFASSDGGLSWVDAGPTPLGLTDLAPTGPGAGFAASRTSRGPKLWSVTGDGAKFTALALPAWVATVGGQLNGS